MLEWSDDDEISVAPPPNTKSPLRSTHVEEQVKKGEKVPEQQATGVLEQQAKEFLVRWVEQRPTVEEAGPPPQNTGVNPTAVPRGSSAKHRFKKLYRQTKLYVSLPWSYFAVVS